MENLADITIGIAIFAAVYVWYWRSRRNGEWHEHTSLKRGTVMRRRLLDGSWQYRELTDDEEVERQSFQR
ncbi:hypothetical protein G6321_00025075 [Bradyrhizobium barranii subsp. barranii]|uniref:Uncharacterized protein n=1 Tax=Bradyrhizobium barranii subsp. barranii TaxID=2823807 RepID=A0A7Z0QI86_9BRAD|nr:hypothetical protein [Bradyrhizobium barranii]UGX98218.1 hypothetical protein G6321_00025075 [Bradyrhizobium barranii subsp. barranii]